MSGDGSILTNTNLWYSVSAVIFLAGAVHYGRKPILGWLDGEIAKVRSELAEAKKLRDEAQATLEAFRNRQQEAIKDAETIVENAKKEAERLRNQAENELKATLARYENKAAARIRMAEAEALNEVRAVVVDQAVKTARKVLADKIDAATAYRLADQAISEIPRLMPDGKAA